MQQTLKRTEPLPSTLIEANNESGQFLTFLLNGETYSLDIMRTKEIIEYGELTRVPLMPDFIRGVINLRGSVVAVVDLSARFGGKCSEVTKRTCIIMVEVLTDDGPLDVGLVVDCVLEVVELSAEDIEPPPSFGTNIRSDFIEGMGKVDTRFVIILNVGKVLSVDELAAIGRVGRRDFHEEAD